MSNTNNATIADITRSVDNEILKIRTKSLDISFNELYDMYIDEELIIAPDYQRLFRWEEEKQSRFIESLILEMPVPPIFVIEIDDNRYELIDGLQRISSYLHFRGESFEKIRETNHGCDGHGNSDKYSGLKLCGCDIVPEINGLIYSELPKALQIKLKRSFVRMEVIKKESDNSLKYHMFKRLNTGGELLSAQEIRNCTIRLLGTRGIDFIDECSKDQGFQLAIEKLGEDKKKARYDQELVLRFFSIKNDIESYRYPVTEYLTRFLEGITRENIAFNYAEEKRVFKETFKLISEEFGADAFSGITESGFYRDEFALYLFDVAISIAVKIDEIKSRGAEGRVRENIEKLKKDKDILRSYKTGSVQAVRGRFDIFAREIKSAIEGSANA